MVQNDSTKNYYPTSTIINADCGQVLKGLPDNYFQLIYIDPPFNTGKKQYHTAQKTVKTKNSDPSVPGEHEIIRGKTLGYDDKFANYWAFLEPKLKETHRILHSTGTFYIHLDYREVHYAKVMLDGIFGKENFLNEIIWSYDYGGKSKRKWPTKHDNILVYVKDHKNYYFDSTSVDREPYMAPGLAGKEKAAKGKLPTDVWWHTIVPTNSKERTGYATQKPEGIINRIITASSRPGDWVLDYFAGSGTTGAVASKKDRNFMLIEENKDAIEIMRERFKHLEPENKIRYL